MRKLFFVWMFLLFVLTSFGCKSISTNTSDTTKSEDLSAFFDTYDGCFVMLNSSTGVYTVYNKTKCENRMPPYDTSDVETSLVGLQSKLLTSESSVLSMPGYPQETLKSAFNNYVPWFFKKIIANVGNNNFTSYLKKINYGNQDITDLQISPIEQVNVMKSIYTKNDVFSSSNKTKIQELMFSTQTKKSTIYGRMGFGTTDPIGLFGGYAVTDTNVYFFCSYVSDKGNSDRSTLGKAAKEISLDILERLLN